jgi:hypothetical protein
MKLSLRFAGVGLGLALACGQATAQCLDRRVPVVPVYPSCPPAGQVIPQPSWTEPPATSAPGTPAPTTPQTVTTQAPTPPSLDLEARAGAGRGEAFALATPNMMGDFAGFCSRRVIALPVTNTVTTTTIIPPPPGTFVIPPRTVTTVTSVPGTQCVYVCDPVLVRAGSGFKIADNESPCPQDRVYFNYNFFDRLGAGGGTTPGTTQVFPITPLKTITVTTPGVTVAGRTADLNRELFGFEKTFLGGDASVELRVPIYQTTSSDGLNGEDFGDLTVILKYAFWRDCNSGSCLSAGLGVTAPTGPGIPTFDGTIHDVLFQPFVAGAWHAGDFFVQGFSAAILPTDSRDATLLFNDFGVGYTLFHGTHDNYVSYVAPGLEVHVTTPLDHRHPSDTVVVADVVDLTPAIYVGIGERATVSFGMSFPVTSAQFFDWEALVQLNYRF